jgi:hypothetical protein
LENIKEIFLLIIERLLFEKTKNLLSNFDEKKCADIAIAKVDKMATKVHRAFYLYDALKICIHYYQQRYDRYRKNQEALKKRDELGRKG